MTHRLTPKQINALHMLASGKSTIQISSELKMRRETFARWRKIPEFMYEYDNLMNEVRHGFNNKITEVMNAAITRMVDVAGGYDSDPKHIEALLKLITTLQNDREKMR